MQVVLLAGGLGTRMREETEFKPKPMVEIGGRPVLWHIMRIFAAHGISDFVVCAGYKGEVIRDYFMNFRSRTMDFTLSLGESDSVKYHGEMEEHGWTLTIADTGADTQTGGRVKRVERYIDSDGTFMVTYGDGLADIDVTELLRFHRSHGRLATVTTIRPASRFGVMDLDADGTVRSFREKPVSAEFVNAGFFVFERPVLELLDENCVLEKEPLEILARDSELVAFKHEGFFQPMDTYREYTMLNEMWSQHRAPWKVWS